MVGLMHRWKFQVNRALFPKKRWFIPIVLHASPLLPDVRKDLIPDLQAGRFVIRYMACLLHNNAIVGNCEMIIPHPLHLLDLTDEIFCRMQRSR